MAHEAAYWGNLPKYFDKWEIKDKKGKTVLDISKKYEEKNKKKKRNNEVEY